MIIAVLTVSCCVVLRVTLDGKQKSAILNVRQLLSQFGYRMRTYSGRNLQEIMSTELERITTSLSLNDLNRVLYHVGCEESDDGFGFGAYNVPGYGDLPYCGLQGEQQSSENESPLEIECCFCKPICFC